MGGTASSPETETWRDKVLLWRDDPTALEEQCRQWCPGGATYVTVPRPFGLLVTPSRVR